AGRGQRWSPPASGGSSGSWPRASSSRAGRTPTRHRSSTGRASPTPASVGIRPPPCWTLLRGQRGRDARLVRALDQAIPEPARRLDKDLADLGLLELLAQAPNVDVDEAGVASRFVAPHTDEEIVARENASGFTGEGTQQLEFGRRQR